MKKALHFFRKKSMDKLMIAAMLLISFSIHAQQQDSVTTTPPLSNNNGSGGISFNVGSNETVDVVELMNIFNNGSISYTIWYNTDSINGAPNITTANGWVAHQTGTVNGITGVQVGVPLTNPIEIPAGKTYGFFIDANMDYHTYTSTDPSVFTDGTLYINTGPNIGYGGAGPTPGNSVRQFLGTVIYEKNTAFNDAGVASVDSLNILCAGTHDVYATIQNFGLNQIDSVDVNWEINGTTQTPVSYKQLLDTMGGTGSNTASILLGTGTFSAGINIIKVYTSNPNGVTDTVNINDTLRHSVQTATPPIGVEFSNYTNSSVDVRVLDALGTVEYEYGPRCYAFGTGTSGSSTTDNFTISGLSKGVFYDLYVRNNCGSGDTSSYIGPISFILDPSIIWQEDFESYIVDSILEPQSSEWVGWGGAITSSYVTDDTAASCNQSMKIWDASVPGANTTLSDVLHLFGDSTSGRYMLKFKVFVPSESNGSGAGTYWNIQHAVDASNNGLEWAMDVQIAAKGEESTITVGGIEYPIPAVYDEWVDVVHIFDLDRDSADFFYNNRLITSNPFSYQSNSTSGTNQLSGIDIYATCGGTNCIELGYYDDFIFKHFPDQGNDAGILSFDTPNYCPGSSTDVEVSIRNFGFNNINSLSINWSIDGVLQTPVSYSSTLAPNDVASVILGTQTFTSPNFYIIKAWTSNPNASSDTINFNDTVVMRVGPALSGNLTLDPSQPSSSTNYQSFADLSNDLNAYGLCGPVNVTVAAGTYNEFLNIGSIKGASSVNTLTIDGQDSSTSILTHDGSTSFATLTLDGAEYVTLKNMTIENTGTITGVAVIFTGGAEYNTVSNNILKVSTSSTSFNVSNVIFSGTSTSISSGAEANYNTVADNVIDGGYYGVRLYGSSSNLNTLNQILDNRFQNGYYYGIYGYYQDSIVISGNHIDMTQRGNTNADGMFLYYGHNTIFSENYIHAPDYGAYIYRAPEYAPLTRKEQIINNMIISDSDYGLYLYYLDSVDIFHNSIVTHGTSAPALQISATSTYPIGNYDVMNNILYSSNTEVMEIEEPDTIFNELDFNLYYTGGTNLFDINGTAFGNLSAYQTVNPFLNTASIEGDPQFLNPNSDLRMLGSLANDVGNNSVGVTIDIEGDPRPMTGSTIVDMGADEYDPPTCLPPLNLNVTNIRNDGADIFWDGVGVDYEYELGPYGFTQGTGIDSIVFGDSTTINGLQPSSNYEYYVREICGRGDTSYWAGPFSFKTLLGVPYFENFEAFTSSTAAVNQQGWTNTSTTTPEWESGTSTSSGNTGPVEDHTIGSGGMFLYLETSGGGLGDFSDLVSPVIPIGPQFHALQFSFWYHKYGATMGDLEVYIDTNGVSDHLVTIPGETHANQTDPWLNFSSMLVGYEGQNVRLRFRGIRGSSFTGDMAIDDVSLDLPPQLNAGIKDLVEPTDVICPGTVSPIVRIINSGLDTITSLQVKYSINGELDSIQFSGSLNTGETADITLNPYTFMRDSVYDILVYTELPNGSLDTNNYDDTLSFDGIGTSLPGGNYTIDPNSASSNTNYQSFTEAAIDINKGICGSVTFTVTAGTYLEAFTLSNVAGTSDTSTITFDGVDSSLVKLIGSSASTATIILDNTDYVTIKNLYIENTGTGSAVILLGPGSDYNVISNNEMELPYSTSTASAIIDFSGSTTTTTSSGSDASYNIVRNNWMKRGYYGIYMYASSGLPNRYNQIINNNIDSVYSYGIYALYQDSLEVVGNEIDAYSSGNANADGASIYYNINTIFNKNSVHANDYGVYLYAYNLPSGTVRERKIEVINNMIISENDFGLALYYMDSVDVFHNSISVRGTSPAMYIYTFPTTVNIENYDVRNNIFDGGSALAFESSEPVTIFDMWDYNLYYTTGTDLVEIDGTVYTDLASLQMSYTAFNASSMQEEPVFVSPTDLHYDGYVVNNMGDNTVGVTTDIDGDSRPIGTDPTVDIGADEFLVPPIDPAVYDLTEPLRNPDNCFGTAENVSIGLHNMGLDTLDFTVDTVNVSVNVSGGTSATINFSIDDNSFNAGQPLAPGDSLEALIGTVDMSNLGMYYFDINIQSTNDGKITNNNFMDSIEVTPTQGGTISAMDKICVGDTVNIKLSDYIGLIQWQELIAGTWTDIAGENMSEIVVSPSNSNSYRAAVCDTSFSDTLNLEVVIVNVPSVVYDTATVYCGNTGTTYLEANSTNSNPEFVWYDAPTGGNIVQASGNIQFNADGDSLILTAMSSSASSPVIDTFYVEEIRDGGLMNDTLDVEPLTGTNGCGAGNMFDVVAYEDLSIDGFTVNTNTSGTQTVDVYVKQGTYDGSQTTATDWTFVESVSVFGNGPGNATYVSLTNSINILNGDTMGVYVDYDADYTNVTTGTSYSNNHMEVIVGDGLCSTFGGVNTGRGFNGQVIYSIEGTCISPSRAMAISIIECVPVPDLALNSLTAPVGLSSGCYTTTEDVEVLIVNPLGRAEMDFSTDSFDVTVNVSGAISQTFNYRLNDNSLNGGLPLSDDDSLLISMGTLDMTAVGSYNFEAYLSSTIDTVATNDTIRSTIANNTSTGTLSASMDTICGSATIDLSTLGSVGDLQWQRLVGGSFVNESNADSTVYEVLVDSTVSYRLLACGTEISDTINIVVNALPAAPSVVNDTAIVFCGDSGTAVLTASSSVSGVINWYEDTTASAVSTGSSFLYTYDYNATHNNTTIYTDTFYVSVVDGTTDCESPMSMVTGTVICTVGEDEMPTAFSGISIQPNPSKGVFQLIGSNIDEQLQISIYNTNGKVVYQLESKVSNNFNEKVDLSNLSKGIYFVKFQGKDSMEMRKVVIH